MNLSYSTAKKIAKRVSARVEILHWSEDSWDLEDRGLDTWVIADEAEKVFRKAGLNIMRNKDLSLVAMLNGHVIGSTFSREFFLENTMEESKEDEDDEGEEEFPGEVHSYDFDLGVDPSYQGGTVGYMLAQAEISKAKSLQDSKGPIL